MGTSAPTQDPFGTPVEPVRLRDDELDPAIDPVEDLDAHVNARWRAANPLPPDRSAWDCFAILQERSLQTQARIANDAANKDSRDAIERLVGDFWRSGLSAEGDTVTERVLRDELAAIASLDAPPAIAEYLVDRHARGWPVLFRFSVDAALDSPHDHIACIGQAGLGMERHGYLDPASQTLRERLREHIARQLRWAGEAQPASVRAANDVVAFETRLAEASLSRRTLARDVSLRQRRVSMATAEQACRNFSWRRFFTALGIEPPTEFSLASPDFHAEWQHLLDSAPASTWRAYLAFHTITSIAAFAGREPARSHHDFFGTVLAGQRFPKPRWKLVLDTINAHVGDALGELYVRHEWSEHAAAMSTQLAENLRESFANRIRHSDWMGGATKRRAQQKLAAMRMKIGSPTNWPDWSDLPTAPDTWFANIQAARAFQLRRALGRIGRAVDRDEWRMTPQTVNAAYDPQRNEIVVPVALLQPPFFDADVDAATNLGGIGAVIAHEMTHGFDDQGSRFDADGRLADWWSPDDRMRFNERAEGLVRLFDAQTGHGGDPVDGTLTLGENIADFGGLAIAFDALMRSSAGSPDIATLQRHFFLAWAAIWRQNLSPRAAAERLRADTHAPAFLRARLPANDIPAFLTAFDRASPAEQPSKGIW